MKNMKTILLTLIALSAPALSLAGNWNIDKDHSFASFKVQHMMITDVRGSFNDVQGVALIDENDVTRSKIDVTIAAASIDTRVKKRDDHLKSADFFDVEKYPTLTFKSTRIEKTADNKIVVVGNLTIHGVTKEVELNVSGPSAEAKDPWGNIRKGASATTKINRKDFGLVWNSTLDNGGLLVGEEVEIELAVEFIKQAS